MYQASSASGRCLSLPLYLLYTYNTPTFWAYFRIRLGSSNRFLSFFSRLFSRFDLGCAKTPFFEFACSAQAPWPCCASSAICRPSGRCRRGAARSATSRIWACRISNEYQTPRDGHRLHFPIRRSATSRNGAFGRKPPYLFPEKPRIRSRKRRLRADERGRTPP